MKNKKLTRVQRLAQVWAHKKFRYPFYAVSFLLLLYATAAWWNPIVFPPVKQAHIGVSFSLKQTAMLDLDWKKTYLALLDDMQIKNLRLMSYWDLHEPQDGSYDFSLLDEQINIAREHGARVSLAIGLRQPRWPECHQPDWAMNLDELKWENALQDYIKTVVNRYKNNPAVTSWQLENEYYNGWFAKCRLATPERLTREFNLVRSLTTKPIWMSMSDQHGVPDRMPAVDAYGFSVYRTVWSTGLVSGYITFPNSIWYHRLRAAFIKATTNKPIFIHELQLEPWGPTDIPYLSTDEQNKSMSTEQIKKSMLYAREIGEKDIYVWGGEWWYWRKVNGDPSIWNTVKQEIETAER